MQALPIDPVLPEITRALAGAEALVLEAPAGAGKTTRVPAALLAAGLAGSREIVVAEPRRLAARLAAHRVAFERGERVGETIGYSVRFEQAASERTRIRYVTDGVLLRRLLQDPELRGVQVVVLDEFHERHLATDLVLSLVRRLQQTRRPDLKLLVMSATLDAGRVAAYLGECRRIQSEGRVFPLGIEHLEKPDTRLLEKQVASAVRRALALEPDGAILVFLPGASEIRRARVALEELEQSFQLAVFPLHGELSIEEQVRAVEPNARRKVVLSTNVAETSITIDGVSVVIDTGLSRIAEYSPWTGLPRLRVAKVSRASATQRAGRAGRTRPGRVLRLYTKGDFEARPAYDLPEVRRSDVSEALLLLHGAGVQDPKTFAWLDAPEPAAFAAAETLLLRLSALDGSGAITDIGRRMLAFPVQPRLARLLVEGERREVAEHACLIAALLGERDIRQSSRTNLDRTPVCIAHASGPSDLLELAERFAEARQQNFDVHRLRAAGLDARSVSAVDRACQKLVRLVRKGRASPLGTSDVETALGLCTLAAFPDRVARRKRRGEGELILASGGTARLSEQSVVHEASFIVAVDVEERTQLGKSSITRVRLASAIEPEWLLEVCPDALTESEELFWNPETERVERIAKMSCGSVVIDESRSVSKASHEASELLLRAVLAMGPVREDDALKALISRIDFLRGAMPELGLPDLGEEPGKNALQRACQGRISLVELAEVDPSAELLSLLDGTQQRALFEYAPERLTLSSGRSLKVSYETGKPPWVAARLQDFFGMSQSPEVAAGRVSLTLHLLAPNLRAVQVTSDLAGFWAVHYKVLRRQLMRRYPKHAWPEDGRSAKPPEPRKR